MFAYDRSYGLLSLRNCRADHVSVEPQPLTSTNFYTFFHLALVFSAVLSIAGSFLVLLSDAEVDEVVGRVLSGIGIVPLVGCGALIVGGLMIVWRRNRAAKLLVRCLFHFSLKYSIFFMCRF